MADTDTIHHEPPAPTSPAAPADDRGRRADRPRDIPADGWKDLALRVKDEAQRDQATLLASGVAFWGLLSLLPAFVALVSLYGLVADPQEVADQVADLSEAAPESVRNLLTDQMESIVDSAGGRLGLGLVLGVAAALWTASSGMKYLIDALNVAYDEEETRGFVKVRGLALLLTLGAILFVAVTVGVIAVLPAALGETGLDDAGRTLARWAPYPMLALLFIGGLAVLYRYAPDRDRPQWRWATPGALVATVLWIVASLGFSWYASNFGSYNETYGSLGAVIVLMLWLFLTALSVVLGAELDSEMEAQTARDSTVGHEEPMGTRGAVKADELGAASPDG